MKRGPGVGDRRRGRKPTETHWLPRVRGVKAMEARYFDLMRNNWVDKWTEPVVRPNLDPVKALACGGGGGALRGRPYAAARRAISRRRVTLGGPGHEAEYRTPAKAGLRCCFRSGLCSVLSVAVFALAKYVNQEIDTSREANLALDAKALAHSGLTMALNLKVGPQTPGLLASFGQNRGYRVQMVSEGGKLRLERSFAGRKEAEY